MPRVSRRRSQRQNASSRRSSNTKISDPSDSSGDEYVMDIDAEELSFNEKILLTDIGDLAEMCKLKCGTKYLSTLVYMSLRFFHIKWENVDEYLKSIGFISAQTCHKWAKVFSKGDYEEFSNDLRGSKQTDSFYDTFPETEADAKAFAVQACSQKSERSCRLDLRRWRAKFEAHSQRPYFEGHERGDVVKHHNEFIGYFLAHKDYYYTITNGEIQVLKLVQNVGFLGENTPFFSKGRGRRHMISDFLVQHPGGPIFELSENEWKEATAKYITLSVDSDVNYIDRTATASINIGTDAYFDNDTVLGQFERLFQMLEFKQEYKHNQIEIVVDNARTHTAKSYSLQEFG
ncbi:unnamed protein product, partial [Didymodactylos carnosus]